MNEFQKEEIRNMVGFPEDVIIDILLRLPSKSLVRSRCVSKYWDTLITSPSFIKAHLHRASKLCHLICQESSKLMMAEIYNEGYSGMYSEKKSVSKLKMRLSGCCEFSNLDPPPAITSGFNDFKLVDSLNGIACLYAVNQQASASKILLWNPAINDCFVVPEPRFSMSSASSCCVGFGFGFNPLTNHLSDFKVISVTLCYEEWPINEKHSPRAEIYSRRTNSWKELVGWIPKWPPSDITGNQVIYEEYICWNPYYRTWNDNGYNNKMAIVSFNVVTEEFHEMPLPNSIPKTYDLSCITLLDGCVSLMAPYSEGYEIWTMKEFGNIESWSKLYNIVLDTNGDGDDDFDKFMFTPLGFASSDEALFLRWFSYGFRAPSNKEMCSYDTRIRDVDESKSVTFDYSIEDCCLKLYVESLISVSYVS